MMMIDPNDFDELAANLIRFSEQVSETLRTIEALVQGHRVNLIEMGIDEHIADHCAASLNHQLMQKLIQ